MAYSIEILIQAQLFYRQYKIATTDVIDIYWATANNGHSFKQLPANYMVKTLMHAYKLTNHIKHNKGLLNVILLLVAIGTDQITKFLARVLLEGSMEICFSHCFIKFSLIENHGGFLGVVNNLPENIRFFLLTICVSVLLLGCLLYLFYFRKKRARYDLPLVFVAGGGMSNLLDRLLQSGGVTDFLSIGVGNVRTGIFNLADVYILIGSFVLGFMLFSFPQNTAQSR